MMLSLLMSLLYIVAFVGVIVLVVWCVRALVGAFETPEKWATLIYVVAFVLVAIVVVSYLPELGRLLARHG